MDTTMIREYWDQSSDGYSDIVIEELETEMKRYWFGLIEANRPQKEHLTVLDAGCGPGFFSILMAEQGHTVHAVDFSREMLEKAQRNADHYGVAEGITFHAADVEALPFPDGSFDLVLSRNLTWTLLNPTQVYREWLRVLRPGGCFLVFDANWNHGYYDEGLRRLMEEDERTLERMGYTIDRSAKEGEDPWAHSLPLNYVDRPLWDVQTLLRLGCPDVRVLTDLPRELMNEYYSTLYTHMPIFMVRAGKA